jgi:hypothetical protein
MKQEVSGGAVEMGKTSAADRGGNSRHLRRFIWRQLSVGIMLFGLLAMLPAVTSNPAFAASRTGTPPPVHASSLILKVPSASNPIAETARVVHLSNARCAILKQAIARAHHAVPKNDCVVGLGLSLRRVGASPLRTGPTAAGSTTQWFTYQEKATSCWFDPAIWGPKNNSFSCGEGSVTLTAYYEFDGVKAYEVRGAPVCTHGYAPTFGIGVTRCGNTGNGSADVAIGANWDWSQAMLGGGTGWMTIYCHDNGAATLYSNWLLS